MVLDNPELSSLADGIFKVIFQNKPSIEYNNQTFPITRMKRTGLRFVTIEGYLFIEQNPAKKSKWAELARQGHQILWVIKENKYLIRVQDGTVQILGSKR